MKGLALQGRVRDTVEDFQIRPVMGKTNATHAAALALLLSGGGFIPAQAHCPTITDSYCKCAMPPAPPALTNAKITQQLEDLRQSPRPDPGAPGEDCSVAKTPAPASILATAQGSPPPPAPPALPEGEATQQLEDLGQDPKPDSGAPGKDGALGQQGATTDLAIVLGSLPRPRVAGWAVSTSVTSVGSVAVGLAHLVEDESRSVSLGVGTDWKHTQGVAVVSLQL